MWILDIFKKKEAPTPKRIIELAVFSLGSEFDLYRLSQHLRTVFGNPLWERFGGRRSVVFSLEEGALADEVPYRLSIRLFEDGGGLVKLDLDLSNHMFDLEIGPLWHRREFSAALTRFLEAALSTRDPEGLKHARGANAALERLGIVAERIAGELDFGFTLGTSLIKIGVVPKEGVKLVRDPQLVLLNGTFHLESEDEKTLAEIERWAYREGTSSWHRLSLRRWLERMDDVRGADEHVEDFARFLRRVNRFIMRERRFGSSLLPAAMLEAGSEFALLVADFDPTSRRLSEVFSARQEDAVEATLSELRRLSAKQEQLFAAWVVLVAVAGLFLGVLYLFFPGASWLWMIGAACMIAFPLGAYYLWGVLRRKPWIETKPHVSELERRRVMFEASLGELERDKTVPEEFRDELLTRARRELARLERLIEDKKGESATKA